MRQRTYLVIAFLAVVSLLAACAPAAPTAAPAAATKAPAAATAAPAAPTAAPKTDAAAPTAAPAAKIKRGGNLVRVQYEDTNSWDPIFALNSAVPAESPALESLIYWQLADSKTGKHDLKPQLAESWDVSDPKSIVLKLRKGVKFHDGSEFNAEAVRWVLERARTDPKSATKGYLSMVSSIEAPDASTVKLNLKQPSAVALLNLTAAVGGTGSPGLMIVSKAYAEKNGVDALGEKPIGTGPLVLSDWKKDDRATYKKFDGYWRQGEDGKPLPYLDGMDVKVIRDKSVALIEVKTGAAQIIKQIEDKDVAGAKADSNVGVTMITWAATPGAIGFNQAKEPFGKNLKLRQAAQYALDRESIAKILGFGNAWADYYNFWIPSYPGYDETLPTFKYDLAKAKSLVAEAGFANGAEVALTFDAPNGQKQAELEQQMWAQAGIKATLVGLDGTTRKANTKTGNWEAVQFGMTPSPDPDMWSRMYTCEGSANWSNYCNKEMDKCMDEGGQLTDAAKRHEIYKRCQKILIEDSQIFGVFMTPNNAVARKEVKGLKLTQHLLDMREVWLDK